MTEAVASAPSAMRFSVEQWAPEYGAPVGEDALGESRAEVDVGVEVEAGQWSPRWPSDATRIPAQIAFVDGVRRIEARVWVESEDGSVHQGICASYGAGVVRCNGRAEIVDARVERGLFCDASGVEPIVTRHGRFAVRPVTASSAVGDALPLALQAAMGGLERAVSADAVAADGLLVVDGPLGDRARHATAVGYVKTHHVAYLPADLIGVVHELAPGQRTPVFAMEGRFPRWSWYQRLPGGGSHGWAGIVRGEYGSESPLEEAASVADSCTLALPRFASEPHKDSRAPQNLYPIAGLERELRRRLGDPSLLYRALRAASAGS